MKLTELAEGLRSGKWSCEDLVRYSLKKIAEEDSSGHALNSIAEINPDALFLARALDQEMACSGPRSLLHGIPVVVKDNINVKDVMHTTAGSLALGDLITETDATVVKKLKEAGALILGKANLSEFAHWMDNEQPSGFSSRGGQVVSPYKKGFDPSGSSSGSAVAVAARLVPYAIGTETDGSLTSPGRANAVVVIKPTIGRVSRSGIIPISHIQDTAGPMGVCVEDCAAVLEVLQGRDEADPATWNSHDETYLDACVADIKGWKVGLVRTMRWKGHPSWEGCYQDTKRNLEELGAEVVEVELDDRDSGEGELLYHEFKNGMERYLASVSSRTKMKHLSDIIRYNEENAEACLKYGQQLLIDSDATSGMLTEKEYIERRAYVDAKTHELIDGTIEKYGLKCLVMTGVSHIAPVSGNPVVSIPAATIDETQPDPLSVQFIGRPYTEKTLIRAAYTLEKKLNLQCIPSWTKEYYED